RLIFEHAAEAAPYQAVIIDQEYRNFFRHAIPGLPARRPVWELAGEPPCHPLRVSQTQYDRPAVPLAPAWPPDQGPGAAHLWLAPSPGPRSPVAVDSRRSGVAPRLS